MKLSSRKKILLGVFLLVVLASASFYEVGYVVAQSLSNRATISSGPYPGGVTTVYSFGGTYYAKDAYGTISYSSTDAATTINAVVSALNSVGGTIEVKAGTYTWTANIGELASPITNINFIGEGQKTVFTSTGDFLMYLGDNCSISNVFFDTFGTVLGSGTALAVVGNNVIVNHNWFSGTQDKAIGVYGTPTPTKITIVNNQIFDCVRWGIQVIQANDIVIANNVITDTTWESIALYGNNIVGASITGNVISSSDMAKTIGIQVSSTGSVENIAITGNVVKNSGNYGIHCDVRDTVGYYLRDVTISGNVVKNTLNQGIFLYALDSVGEMTNLAITGNTVTDFGIGSTNKIGIQVTSGNKTTIIGNTVRTTETTASTVNGIYINKYGSGYNTNYGFIISNNIVSAPNASGTKIGIFCNYMNDALITNNVLEDSLTIVGTLTYVLNDWVYNNVGWKTEVSALGTFPVGDTYTITNPLVATPNCILISWRDNIGARTIWWTANTTHIVFHTDIPFGGNYNFNYEAKYVIGL